MSAGRSPAYPYVDLEKAVELIHKIHSFAKGHSANTESMFKHLGFNGMTGSARKTLAALKYYGLLEQAHGSKEAKLTQRAMHIIHGVKGSEEQRNAVVEAFLEPAIYTYCWDTWGSDDISEEVMRSHLILKKGFNDSTVMGFINGYKQSMKFANVAQNGTIDGDGEPNLPEVGDYIQWESQGELKLPKPRKVVSLSEDSQYIFVEGSYTGIPVSEVTVIDDYVDETIQDKNPPVDPPKHGGVIPPRGENMRQETFTLNSGDILIQFPASMSNDDFEDFSDWIEILKRKVGRSVVDEEKSENNAGEE